jgi:CO dehydrogenase maturation factor
MPSSIAVAGKGGTGKTSIAALLILYLRDHGMGPVLAVDADPDANLGALLGVTDVRTIGDLRDEVKKEFNNLPAGMTKASYVEAGLHQIISENDGFDLITMGKGEGAGCYCYLNSLIRKFSDDLYPSYKWVVMDNEAGLEHINRRTTANIDTLLVITNQNPISFLTARKINDISAGLKNGIKKKYLITNFVRDERREEITARVKETGMELLCDLPYDPELESVNFSGKPLTALADSITKEKIKFIIEKIGGTYAIA